MAITKDNLEAALDQAVTQDFIHLFSILVGATDPDEAIKRFEKGLQKLIDTEAAVLEVIENIEE